MPMCQYYQFFFPCWSGKQKEKIFESPKELPKTSENARDHHSQNIVLKIAKIRGSVHNE